MFAIAKITAKGQTTIPLDVRTALKVTPGDLIAWEVGADEPCRLGIHGADLPGSGSAARDDGR